MSAVVTVEGLTRYFGGPHGVCAVDGVDLTVHRGQFLALLGPSGCGKTTLLRLVAGFDTPDAGRITVDGTVVCDERTWAPPERRRIGMVFQDYALFPHLTVADNVAFGLPRSARRRGQRVAEILALVGLHNKAQRYPQELSGGEQQRVALARALAPGPSVVLLDEPFSNLDATLRAEVRAEVRRILHEAGTPAVFVTHDQEEALSLSHEVAVMHAGRIHQLDSPEGLYRRPADRTVAEFVGDANFLPGQVSGAQVSTDIGDLPIAETLSTTQRTVDVLLRPEDVRVVADSTGDAVVVDREYYGHDQVLFVRLPSGYRLRARFGSVTDLGIGDRCRAVVDGAVRVFPPRDA